MHDTEDLLERARLRAPEPRFELEDLTRRRERRVLRGRIEAAVVGLSLAVAATLGAVTALRPHGPGSPIPPGAGTSADAGWTSINLPPAPKGPLVAGPGEYYYQRVHEYIDCSATPDPAACDADSWELEAEAWWAPDDSGRIVVTTARNYGALEGTFGPGEFPSEGDTRVFPTDTLELEEFLAQRSEAAGASPRPFGTPYPGGSVRDGQVWMAIVDFLGSSQYWNTTPTLRAALLDVLAGLSISSVQEDATDTLGRPAIVVELTAYDVVNRVYVDPETHDFLALSRTFLDGEALHLVVEAAGVATSTDEPPSGDQLSIPRADSPPAGTGKGA